jgi:hypothetical protein
VGRAITYDISVDPDRGRWYLDASWKTTPQPAPVLGELRAGGVVGEDLNADHLAACVLDASGNPIGAPVSIAVDTAGLFASTRNGRVRAAITLLLYTATHHQCAAVVVENLDFADARATGRETLGRGARGKRLRRTVAGIPNRQVPRPADRHGRPARRRGHRCGCGLHQPLGHPTLAPPFATADF